MRMCLDSGRVRNASRNVRNNNNSAPWNGKMGKGPKGPSGRDPPAVPGSVPPTVSDKRPHVVPPCGGPPGAGVKASPSTTPHDGESMPFEDMLKALKLLQSVMTEEDLSKF